jgi:hypothetical protein
MLKPRERRKERLWFGHRRWSALHRAKDFSQPSIPDYHSKIHDAGNLFDWKIAS